MWSAELESIDVNKSHVFLRCVGTLLLMDRSQLCWFSIWAVLRLHIHLKKLVYINSASVSVTRLSVPVPSQEKGGGFYLQPTQVKQHYATGTTYKTIHSSVFRREGDGWARRRQTAKSWQENYTWRHIGLMHGYDAEWGDQSGGGQRERLRDCVARFADFHRKDQVLSSLSKLSRRWIMNATNP